MQGYYENAIPFLLLRRSEMSVFFLTQNQKGGNTHFPSRAGTVSTITIMEVIQESFDHSISQKEKR